MQVDQVVSLQREEDEQRVAADEGATVKLAAAASHSDASGLSRSGKKKYQYKHYGRAESKVNFFTLSFRDGKLETAYRAYMVTKSARRTRWACAAFIACLIVFGCFEFFFGYSTDGAADGDDPSRTIASIRFVTACLPLMFLLFVSPGWKPKTLETIIGTNFAVHGVLLVAAVLVGSWHGLPHFFPFAWWSSSFDMVHCAVTQLSGVRFPVAASVALLHPFLLCIGFIALRRGDAGIGVGDDLLVGPGLQGNGDQLMLLCACVIGCLLVAYRREHIERKEFVSLLNVTADKRMRQDLINDMLPEKIRDLLQYGTSASSSSAPERPMVSRGNAGNGAGAVGDAHSGAAESALSGNAATNEGARALSPTSLASGGYDSDALSPSSAAGAAAAGGNAGSGEALLRGRSSRDNMSNVELMAASFASLSRRMSVSRVGSRHASNNPISPTSGGGRQRRPSVTAGASGGDGDGSVLYTGRSDAAASASRLTNSILGDGHSTGRGRSNSILGLMSAAHGMVAAGLGRAGSRYRGVAPAADGVDGATPRPKASDDIAAGSIVGGRSPRSAVSGSDGDDSSDRGASLSPIPTDRREAAASGTLDSPNTSHSRLRGLQSHPSSHSLTAVQGSTVYEQQRPHPAQPQQRTPADAAGPAAAATAASGTPVDAVSIHHTMSVAEETTAMAAPARRTQTIRFAKRRSVMDHSSTHNTVGSTVYGGSVAGSSPAPSVHTRHKRGSDGGHNLGSTITTPALGTPAQADGQAAAGSDGTGASPSGRAGYRRTSTVIAGQTGETVGGISSRIAAAVAGASASDIAGIRAVHARSGSVDLTHSASAATSPVSGAAQQQYRGGRAGSILSSIGFQLGHLVLGTGHGHQHSQHNAGSIGGESLPSSPQSTATAAASAGGMRRSIFGFLTPSAGVTPSVNAGSPSGIRSSSSPATATIGAAGLSTSLTSAPTLGPAAGDVFTPRQRRTSIAAKFQATTGMTVDAVGAASVDSFNLRERKEQLQAGGVDHVAHAVAAMLTPTSQARGAAGQLPIFAAGFSLAQSVPASPTMRSVAEPNAQPSAVPSVSAAPLLSQEPLEVGGPTTPRAALPRPLGAHRQRRESGGSVATEGDRGSFYVQAHAFTDHDADGAGSPIPRPSYASRRVVMVDEATTLPGSPSSPPQSAYSSPAHHNASHSNFYGIDDHPGLINSTTPVQHHHSYSTGRHSHKHRLGDDGSISRNGSSLQRMMMMNTSDASVNLSGAVGTGSAVSLHATYATGGTNAHHNSSSASFALSDISEEGTKALHTDDGSAAAPGTPPATASGRVGGALPPKGFSRGLTRSKSADSDGNHGDGGDGGSRGLHKGMSSATLMTAGGPASRRESDADSDVGASASGSADDASGDGHRRGGHGLFRADSFASTVVHKLDEDDDHAVGERVGGDDDRAVRRMSSQAAEAHAEPTSTRRRASAGLQSPPQPTSNASSTSSLTKANDHHHDLGTIRDGDDDGMNDQRRPSAGHRAAGDQPSVINDIISVTSRSDGSSASGRSAGRIGHSHGLVSSNGSSTGLTTTAASPIGVTLLASPAQPGVGRGSSAAAADAWAEATPQQQPARSASHSSQSGFFVSPTSPPAALFTAQSPSPDNFSPSSPSHYDASNLPLTPLGDGSGSLSGSRRLGSQQPSFLHPTLLSPPSAISGGGSSGGAGSLPLPGSVATPASSDRSSVTTTGSMVTFYRTIGGVPSPAPSPTKEDRRLDTIAAGGSSASSGSSLSLSLPRSGGANGSVGRIIAPLNPMPQLHLNKTQAWRSMRGSIASGDQLGLGAGAAGGDGSAVLSSPSSRLPPRHNSGASVRGGGGGAAIGRSLVGRQASFLRSMMVSVDRGSGGYEDRDAASSSARSLRAMYRSASVRGLGPRTGASGAGVGVSVPSGSMTYRAGVSMSRLGASAARMMTSRGSREDGYVNTDSRAAVAGAGPSSSSAAGTGTTSPGTEEDDGIDEAIGHKFASVTVMFVYVSNLSQLANSSDPLDLIKFLNHLYTQFDGIVDHHRVYKVMAIANMYLCVAGALDENTHHAATMASTAIDIMKYIKRHRNALRTRLGGQTVKIQIGLHSGEAAGGVIGTRTFNWHIFGDTVNTASRMCSNNETGRIQVSSATADLLAAENCAARMGGFQAVAAWVAAGSPTLGAARPLDATAALDLASSIATPADRLGARFTMTQRQPSVLFKGKGIISTFWLCDADLMALDITEAKQIDIERQVRRRAREARRLAVSSGAADHLAIGVSGEAGATHSDDGTAASVPPGGGLGVGFLGATLARGFMNLLGATAGLRTHGQHGGRGGDAVPISAEPGVSRPAPSAGTASAAGAAASPPLASLAASRVQGSGARSRFLRTLTQPRSAAAGVFASSGQPGGNHRQAPSSPPLTGVPARHSPSLPHQQRLALAETGALNEAKEGNGGDQVGEANEDEDDDELPIQPAAIMIPAGERGGGGPRVRGSLVDTAATAAAVGIGRAVRRLSMHVGALRRQSSNDGLGPANSSIALSSSTAGNAAVAAAEDKQAAAVSHSVVGTVLHSLSGSRRLSEAITSAAAPSSTTRASLAGGASTTMLPVLTEVPAGLEASQPMAEGSSSTQLAGTTGLVVSARSDIASSSSSSSSSAAASRATTGADNAIGATTSAVGLAGTGGMMVRPGPAANTVVAEGHTANVSGTNMLRLESESPRASSMPLRLDSESPRLSAMPAAAHSATVFRLESESPRASAPASLPAGVDVPAAPDGGAVHFLRASPAPSPTHAGLRIARPGLEASRGFNNDDSSTHQHAVVPVLPSRRNTSGNAGDQAADGAFSITGAVQVSVADRAGLGLTMALPGVSKQQAFALGNAEPDTDDTTAANDGGQIVFYNAHPQPYQGLPADSPASIAVSNPGSATSSSAATGVDSVHGTCRSSAADSSGLATNASLDRERLVQVQVQQMRVLTLSFTDRSLEARFQAATHREVRLQVQRAVALACLIAFAALGKTGIRDVDLMLPSVYSVVLHARLALVALSLACLAGLTSRWPGRLTSSLVCTRLLPCMRYIPAHELLSAIVAVTFCVCMNAELYPAVVAVSPSSSGLANLNFVLLLVFSFLELRAFMLSIVNAICLSIYLALLIAASQAHIWEEQDAASHAFLAAAAAVFSCATSYVREKSRRNRFVVQEQAMRQRDKCERLLLNMLPSQDHAEMLMRGEDVVEVLDDVTMLYSDIKGFTEMSAKMSPEDLIRFLDTLYSAFDKHLDVFGLYKIETIGDAFIVVGGMKRQGKTRHAGSGSGGHHHHHGDGQGARGHRWSREQHSFGNSDAADLSSPPSPVNPASPRNPAGYMRRPRRRSSLATFFFPRPQVLDAVISHIHLPSLLMHRLGRLSIDSDGVGGDRGSVISTSNSIEDWPTERRTSTGGLPTAARGHAPAPSSSSTTSTTALTAHLSRLLGGAFRRGSADDRQHNNNNGRRRGGAGGNYDDQTAPSSPSAASVRRGSNPGAFAFGSPGKVAPMPLDGGAAGANPGGLPTAMGTALAPSSRASSSTAVSIAVTSSSDPHAATASVGAASSQTPDGRRSSDMVSTLTAGSAAPLTQQYGTTVINRRSSESAPPSASTTSPSPALHPSGTGPRTSLVAEAGLLLPAPTTPALSSTAPGPTSNTARAGSGTGLTARRSWGSANNFSHNPAAAHARLGSMGTINEMASHNQSSDSHGADDAEAGQRRDGSASVPTGDGDATVTAATITSPPPPASADPSKPPPLPLPSPHRGTGTSSKTMSHAGAIAAFAMDMLAEVSRVREETGINVQLRIGIHTGKAVGGIIGKTRPRYFIWGEDTAIANAMESSGVVGAIQVSEATARRLASEGFVLEPHAYVDTHGSDHADTDDDGDDDGDADGTDHDGGAHSVAKPQQQRQRIGTYLLKQYIAHDGTTYTVTPGQTD